MNLSDEGFISIGKGLYLNPSDTQFARKALHYLPQDNPFQQARLFVESGQFLKAKQIYFSLLKQKESKFVHDELAPLLDYAETMQMMRKYRNHPQLHQLYSDRLSVLEPPIQKNSLKKVVIGILVGAIIALLLVGTMFFAVNTHQTTTNNTTNRTYNNQIQYVNTLPSHDGSNMISVSTVNPNQIATQVDHQNMTPNVTYGLMHDGRTIGCAKYTGGDNYAVYLLQAPKKTQNAASTISSKDLNTVRTAYMYYLTQHNDTPPTTIDSLKSMVPSSVDLKSISYHPSTDVTKALQPRAGINPPYVAPKVEVNLQARTMTVLYGNQVQFKTKVGVGNQKTPSPTGDFAITARMVSPSSVYGQFVFPLNNSHFAIHGTNAPSRIGENKSLGCIEIPTSADKKMYQTLPVGTQVVISSNQTQSPPTWFL